MTGRNRRGVRVPTLADGQCFSSTTRMGIAVGCIEEPNALMEVWYLPGGSAPGVLAGHTS